MPPKQSARGGIGSWLVFALTALVLTLAGAEIFAMGWGSGNWLGKLSFKWATTLLGFYLFFGTILYFLSIWLFTPGWKSVEGKILHWRKNLSIPRWPLAFIVLLFPAWFVFYSAWGGLFTGLFFRIILFTVTLAISTFLLTSDRKKVIETQTLFVAGLILGSLLVLAESFVLVTDYPFALHWSEGNRLWDYSIAFGADRYNYSGSEPIFAWIDQGRQTLWGLPFFIPGVPIWAVRLWSAILVTIPYAILGWVAFWPGTKWRNQWWFAGLWALLFLNQGPIYTPLVLAAILVAVARRKPIWLALPLAYLAGHYAGISRYSWRFAAGIWVVVVTFGDAVLQRGRLSWRDWLKGGALGLAGIWSKGLPILVGIVIGIFPFLVTGDGAPVSSDPMAQSVENLQGLHTISTTQPFVWERLLPNSIFPPGILLGLALATLPVILLLICLARKGLWKTTLWQKIATVLGLGAMMVVGVIASAKVGGGTDLHNMDMFLIGLVLVAALAWEDGLVPSFATLVRDSTIVRGLLAAAVLIPAFMPMVSGRPLELPSPERTDFVMGRIQDFVACARQYGDVLFMDQRQLLTFGQVGDVPLVVEYEKKYVMDQALAENEDYFERFRSDLASGWFSLIVTEREAILYKEADVDIVGDSLNEENNAWVKWVTTPLLSYYESAAEYKDAAIELFLPIERSFDCP
jgi:hypothetical protein